ncbi:MAG: hypothetical protein AAB548_01040 [Patescibacteria group bacterium]
MERDSLPVVEIKPGKPSSLPIIGLLLDRLRTRQEPVTRFTMPESRAQEAADDMAEKYRQEGKNAVGKTKPSNQRTF